jgi:hypothetical protein
MIGSLLYLTATRPDIQFSICLCARFQASPKTLHRLVVKRIFRYLRHTSDFGLWYFASSSLALSYGPPWAHYLGGYQDRLLGGPLGLPGLRYTAPEGMEHKDYTGVVLG